MKKLTICYLPHRPSRIKFANIVFHYLSLISPKHKEKICVKILHAGNAHIWQQFAEHLVANGIETYTAEFPFTLNYMDKIRLSCESDTEYCCKLDDDAWFSQHLWEYIIDNLDVLQDDKNVVLAPNLSISIPQIESFIEGLGSSEEVKKMYDLFHSYKFEPLWGADYTPLNKVNETTKEWDKELFYNEVNKIDHYYKGIHPLRLQEEAQIKINDLAIKHYDKIKEKQNYSMEIKQVPYLTNTVFFIKTQTWKKIIEDQSLFKDAFDEVPINLYIHQNNFNYVFTKEGYGIHIFYNCVKNFETLTDIYFEKYLKIL